MGLFHRNENEANFAGGSKNIRESLQQEPVNNQVLVNVDSREDFNTGSVINVDLGYEAMFVSNGEIVGVMPHGRHELSTDNYPFLGGLRNMITGGVSTFSCKVYYVRIAHSTIPWGTPNGIQYQDNWFKCPTKARGFGEYWITFKNIPTFVAKLMGGQPIYTVADLQLAFNGQINSQITRTIAKSLGRLTRDREILAFNDISEEIEQILKPDIQELLDEYGLELKRYFIENLEIEEDERRAAAISAATVALAESRAKVQQAQGDVAAFQTYGSTYQTIKGMELLKDIANNPGAGGIASAGAGLGMGMAAGNVFGSIAQTVFSGAMPNQQMQQPQTYGAGNRFGNNAQPQSQPQTKDPMEELGKLKQMLDAGFITSEQFELKRMLIIGMITQEQYDAKIAEIMSRM